MQQKSTAHLFAFNKEDVSLFKDVVFLVEATYNEQHMLWERYHYRPDPDPDQVQIKSWEQTMMGRGVQIGTVDDRSINVSISYAILNGKKVLFYYGVSQLVDHKMIEDWLKMYSLDTIRWDNGHRWAHCDAANFHHCMEAVGAYDNKRSERVSARTSRPI